MDVVLLKQLLFVEYIKQSKKCCNIENLLYFHVNLFVLQNVRRFLEDEFAKSNVSVQVMSWLFIFFDTGMPYTVFS